MAGRPVCPACEGEDVFAFWRVDRLPVLCHGLYPSAEQARAVPHGPLELTFCRGCGLVHNSAFDPERIRYDRPYENALHFSQRFRQYTDALAQHLVTDHGMRGKRALEIGCGDGQFLERVCRLGGNEGLGLDPAFDPQRCAVPDDANVRLVAAEFEPRIASQFPADLICCRHVLEHLPGPMTLLGALREAVGGRGALLYFEVPNLLHTLQRMGVWDLIYEHCLYFTPTSLRQLFRAAGFEPIDSGEAYGGQFAWVEAVPCEHAADTFEAPGVDMLMLQRQEDLARRFERRCREHVRRMRDRLAALDGQAQRAVVWGAGSKTVTMLNLLEIDTNVVPYVVDQNPRKHGYHIAGTGQRIIAPEQLPDVAAQRVIVMNPLYQGEIARSVAQLGLDCQIITA